MHCCSLNLLVVSSRFSSEARVKRRRVYLTCECVELWRVRVELWRLRCIYDEKLDLTTDFAYFCGCIVIP